MHRADCPARMIARSLKISPNTERRYRRTFERADLMVGPHDVLPSSAQLQAAIDRSAPALVRRTRSSVAPWSDEILALLQCGETPSTIHRQLATRHREFHASLSAVKRMCLKLHSLAKRP